MLPRAFSDLEADFELTLKINDIALPGLPGLTPTSQYEMEKIVKDFLDSALVTESLPYNVCIRYIFYISFTLVIFLKSLH